MKWLIGVSLLLIGGVLGAAVALVVLDRPLAWTGDGLSLGPPEMTRTEISGTPTSALTKRVFGAFAGTIVGDDRRWAPSRIYFYGLPHGFSAGLCEIPTYDVYFETPRHLPRGLQTPSRISKMETSMTYAVVGQVSHTDSPDPRTLLACSTFRGFRHVFAVPTSEDPPGDAALRSVLVYNTVRDQVLSRRAKFPVICKNDVPDEGSTCDGLVALFHLSPETITSVSEQHDDLQNKYGDYAFQFAPEPQRGRPADSYPQITRRVIVHVTPTGFEAIDDYHPRVTSVEVERSILP